MTDTDEALVVWRGRLMHLCELCLARWSMQISTVVMLAAAVLVAHFVTAEESSKSAADYDLTVVVQTNAHEGPVFVPSQGRLYFTTKPDFTASDTHIAINYLDIATTRVASFRSHSNMANGMWLSRDGKSLLVAEQGTFMSPGAISRIALADGKREVVIDEFQGKPFNSPNKVIESSAGWIYFSDPDYGHNQGFKPAPLLPMAVYAHDTLSGATVRLSTAFDRPHGLALSPNENVLYVGDTAAVDGRSSYKPGATHGVFDAKLLAPDSLGVVRSLLQVPVGIPDGVVTSPNGDLFVAAGDGVRHYSDEGKFLGLMAIENGAVNLTLVNGVLYITADTAIYRATPQWHLPTPNSP
ncbi:MAG: SMP-30/gluconolactonase/LRE family protein [Halioglobus sp.]|nr:SMP-30/gluconolactonase/LRE family protein [Halioglobus sp.]